MGLSTASTCPITRNSICQNINHSQICQIHDVRDAFLQELQTNKTLTVRTVLHIDDWDFIVPDDFHSIQDALDHAQNGFRIFVREGTYYEHVTIRLDDIVLQGASKETTIIDGMKKRYDVVSIQANDVSVSGFTIKGSGMNEQEIYHAGILASGITNLNITNCIIQNNNGYGIVLDNSIHCTFVQNMIYMNHYDGMYILDSHQCIIASNKLEKNTENAISCYSSSSNIIRNNTITSTNTNAIVFSASSASAITGNNITGEAFTCIKLQSSSDNMINENIIYSKADEALSLLYKSNKNRIHRNTFIGVSSTDTIGILNYDSDFNELYGNAVSSFAKGIEIWTSMLLVIQSNEIVSNTFGITMKGCFDIRITNNNMSSNKRTALDIDSSNNIIIQNNTITDNGFHGIHMVSYSDYSAILENRILYNSKDGINLDCCDYATISDNFIAYNELNGLFIFESSNASVDHNLLIENKDYGLYLKHDDFKVGSHMVVDNRFYECGVFSERSFKNFFQNNTINDLPLLYLEGITDYTVSDQSYGSIMLISCDRITIQHQKIHNTSIAVQLLFSYNCTITQNDFNDNDIGVNLFYSSSINIIANNFKQNELDAAYIIWESDPLIKANTWNQNYWGSSRSVIFPIHGYKYLYILDIWLLKVPTVCFDVHPSSTPYDFSK